MRTIKRMIVAWVALWIMILPGSLCAGAVGEQVLWATVNEMNAEFYLPQEGDVSACQVGTTPCDILQSKPVSELDVPIKTLILLDNSLSIPKEERPIIAQLLNNLIGNRMDGEQFTIATIEDDIHYLCTDESDYLALGSAINSITYQNQDTQLTDNLYKAIQSLYESSPLQLSRVIVIADGVDDKEIGKLDLETRHSINNRKQYAHSFEAPSARVLIVDDDEVNLLVEKKLLRDTKMQIDTVSGGAECLQKTQYVRYDVILMDHLMPEMDGIECLHHIRAQNGGLNRETPVVVLTANAGSENSLLYTQEGFDGILTKPVSGARLEAGIRDCLPPDKIRNVGTDGSVGIMEAPVLSYRKKIPVVITTESVCDLPKSLLEKYHIAVIPHKVITEAGVFLDGQELDSDGLISYINGGGGMVWTDAPSLEDLSSFFAGQLTKAQHVIHITLAKRVPPYAYAKAVEAAKIFENVSIVDSGHLSSGMGLMVLKAAQDASAGVPVAQILKHCDSLRPRIRTSFVVDSTDFLVRNAQISARANKLCDAFMLHPVLAMKKSAIRVSGIKVGTRLYVLRKYVRSALRVTGEIDRSLLFITYVGLSGDDLQEIKSLVAKIVDFEQVICQKSCPSISANCGPGTFGLLFLMKEN